MHLESLPSLSQEQRTAYADLAMSIFLEHPPVDPHNLREASSRDKRAAGGSKGRELLLEELGEDPDQVGGGGLSKRLARGWGWGLKLSDSWVGGVQSRVRPVLESTNKAWHVGW